MEAVAPSWWWRLVEASAHDMAAGPGGSDPDFSGKCLVVVARRSLVVCVGGGGYSIPKIILFYTFSSKKKCYFMLPFKN